jgi:hypothetical protein
VVHGTVLKGEERESDFGVVTKMTVKSDLGFIVWCTMPSGMSADKGDSVAFKATLTPSDTDTKFAFGKRPTVVAVPQGQLEKLPQGDGDEQDEQPQDTDPENIYGLSSIAQSIAEDKRKGEQWRRMRN